MNEKNFQLAVQLRHELHQHPELPFQETWTKQHLMEFLKAHTTKFEIVDRGQWFYAVYRAENPKKRVAFRGDFDALPVEDDIEVPYRSQCPGVGHKCGHDGHVANLCLMALEIEENDAENDVYLVYQPAEEIGGGGQLCALLMEEEGIDEVYAFHNKTGIPRNSVIVKDGGAYCASKGLEIVFTGVPAHASTPELGKNPAFAIAALINALPGFTVLDDDKGIVLCTVIQVALGEWAFGVSAHKGSLLLTIRAEYEAELDELQKKLEALAEEQAKKYGLSCQISECDVFPQTANDPECARRVRQVCKNLGIPLGEQKHVQRGSEDFGYFTKKTRGAIFWVGNGEDYPPIHNVRFDFVDEIMQTATAIFLALAE